MAIGLTEITMRNMSAAEGAELMDVYARVYGFEPLDLRFWFWGAEGEEHALTEGVLVDQGVIRDMVLTILPRSAYTGELQARRKERERVGRNRCEACGEERETEDVHSMQGSETL